MHSRPELLHLPQGESLSHFTFRSKQRSQEYLVAWTVFVAAIAAKPALGLEGENWQRLSAVGAGLIWLEQDQGPHQCNRCRHIRF